MNDIEFATVKRQLHALTGLDLECYKSVQVRRRLDNYLGRTHATSWPEFLRRLEQNPEEVTRLRDFLTINVSSLFRDRPKWDELRERVLPQLVQRGSFVRAWSAGCAAGGEAYTLAMIMEETPLLVHYHVQGTDIDNASLAVAHAGGPYTPDHVKEVPPGLLARYMRYDGSAYWMQPSLRARVVFQNMDLLRMEGDAEYDLIVCRNVLIYFTEEAKDRVITGLVNRLRPGGILFIGATESVSPARIAGIERVGLSFYRKLQGEV